MNLEKRICENCGRNMPRAAYISFNGGMIVCMSCCNEWENLGSPNSISEYHQAISSKQNYQSGLIEKK